MSVFSRRSLCVFNLIGDSAKLTCNSRVSQNVMRTTSTTALLLCKTEQEQQKTADNDQTPKSAPPNSTILKASNYEKKLASYFMKDVYPTPESVPDNLSMSRRSSLRWKVMIRIQTVIMIIGGLGIFFYDRSLWEAEKQRKLDNKFKYL